jgi:hypothetical protein
MGFSPRDAAERPVRFSPLFVAQAFLFTLRYEGFTLSLSKGLCPFRSTLAGRRFKCSASPSGWHLRLACSAARNLSRPGRECAIVEAPDFSPGKQALQACGKTPSPNEIWASAPEKRPKGLCASLSFLWHRPSYTCPFRSTLAGRRSKWSAAEIGWTGRLRVPRVSGIRAPMLRVS